MTLTIFFILSMAYMASLFVGGCVIGLAISTKDEYDEDH